MSAQTIIPADKPIIVMLKTYDAPRETVWRAITEPRHVQAWWGGAGASNPVCEMDVRPGGIWTHVLRLPDGQEMHMTFQFVSVEKPGRLAWKDLRGEQPQHRASSPEITITLEAQGITRCGQWKPASPQSLRGTKLSRWGVVRLSSAAVPWQAARHDNGGLQPLPRLSLSG